eukprot:symbB.v1.2.014819.t1/scaffold1093.1/size138456/1
MSSPLSSPRRSASRAPFRCQCLERSGPAHHLDEAFPVKLVVFDFDETLTLITYLIEDGDSEEVQRQIVKTNFQTPWVKGSRIEHLKSMLKALSTSNAGHRRALVVLTKNSAGEKAVHLLLHVSGLARYFDAIWALPSGGLYRLKDEWFEIPTPTVCHKADLLALVVESTSDFLPQLNYDAEWKDFGDLKMEGIVLVDDQRANFQHLGIFASDVGRVNDPTVVAIFPSGSTGSDGAIMTVLPGVLTLSQVKVCEFTRNKQKAVLFTNPLGKACYELNEERVKACLDELEEFRFLEAGLVYASEVRTNDRPLNSKELIILSGEAISWKSVVNPCI